MPGLDTSQGEPAGLGGRRRPRRPNPRGLARTFTESEKTKQLLGLEGHVGLGPQELGAWAGLDGGVRAGFWGTVLGF